MKHSSGKHGGADANSQLGQAKSTEEKKNRNEAPEETINTSSKQDPRSELNHIPSSQGKFVS
jgi:hypothetical protein